MSFDTSAIIAALPDLLNGAQLTLIIALIGLVSGFAVGMLLGMARAFGPMPVNAATRR